MKKICLILLSSIVLLSCDIDGYGPKVETGNVEVYYKPDALKTQAKAFASLMDSLEYGKNGEVSFQLLKDDKIHINMVTKDLYFKDESLDYALNAVSLYASMSIFKKDSVQLHITNNKFERQRSLSVFK